jgi:menaquinone-dependent protoporphyrinogen oxidase
VHCLILYGTTEGQTRKIAAFLRDRLAQAGHTVTMVDAVEAPPDLDPHRFDRVILAGSVHIGRYQAAIEDWARRHAAALLAVKAAFVSVSLAAAGTDDDDVKGLAQCVEEFTRRTGWTPSTVYHAAGAFRYTQYDFFKRWALKYIAWRKGAPTDTSQDYELTDWPALERFADSVTTERGSHEAGE